MITMIVHLRVRPANTTAYEAMMTHVVDMTRKHEPGVLYYAFSKSVSEADTYVVIEVYRDAAAHAAHMASPWVVESIPVSRSLVEGSFDIKQYIDAGQDPVELSHG